MSAADWNYQLVHRDQHIYNDYHSSYPPHALTHTQSYTRAHTHSHLVHPSPVRAHSYPVATFSTGAGLFAGTHPSTIALQAWSATSAKSSHYAPSLSHSHAHSSSSAQFPPPSPPLSTSAMPPDPWGAERESIHSEDEGHPWGTNLPSVGLPMSDAKGMPHSPRETLSRRSSGHAPNGRPLSPVSKKLLAPVALEVWAGVLDKSKGRDKILKTVQYTLRTYLYVLGLVAGMRVLPMWFASSQKRSKVATSGLSLTRKCLLLFNPLRPAGALLSPEPTSARAFLGHLIDLYGSICDDIFCLSKLGLVSRRKGVWADKWANRVWFYNTIVGLYGMWLKQGMRRSDKEKRADQLQLRKYLCDLIFVSYDIFHLKAAKEPMQCIVGLTGAIVSVTQLYEKEYTALAKR